MEELKNKIIPVEKVRQFYKRFANGEQYIELCPVMGIVKQDKRYYWQQQKVFNHIKLLINMHGEGLTEEQLYGRHGLVSLLEPYQREYNHIMNLHSEHIDLAVYGVLSVEDGSVDTDEICEDGITAGKIIVYRQGAKSPEFQLQSLNTHALLESADFILAKMHGIAANFRKTNKKG